MATKKDEFKTYLHLTHLLKDMIQNFGEDQTLVLIETAVEVAFEKTEPTYIKLVSTN